MIKPKCYNVTYHTSTLKSSTSQHLTLKCQPEVQRNICIKSTKYYIRCDKLVNLYHIFTNSN